MPFRRRTKMSSFEVITGFWKRRSASRNNNGNREEYFYGKPKIEESIVINPGDELYMFSTTANNAGRGAPQMFLKVKRKTSAENEDQTNNA